jgi:hypothetical protein
LQKYSYSRREYQEGKSTKFKKVGFPFSFAENQCVTSVLAFQTISKDFNENAILRQNCISLEDTDSNNIFTNYFGR